MAGTTVAVGVLSFDVFLPPGPAAGVNSFTISNLTGDPSLGGFALEPDFPIASFVGLANSVLSLQEPAGSVDLPLGLIPPGFFSSPSLQFPDTQQFLEATFRADLPAVLQLLDGTVVTVANRHLEFSLNPASGVFLSPGSDFVVLAVDVMPTAIPEPQTWILTSLVLLAMTLTLHRQGASDDRISRR